MVLLFVASESVMHQVMVLLHCPSEHGPTHT
jgi:hypothetical protein